MIAQLFSAMIGIWLMAAPALLDATAVGSDVQRVIGPLVATFAVIASAEHLRAVRWWNIPVAAALLIAVVAVDFGGAAAVTNAVGSACAIVLLSLRRGRISHRYGGGWMALLRR